MKQVLVVLMCLGIISFVALAAPSQILKNCCLKYSGILPQLKRIKEYVIQKNDGRCKIKAVIFKVKNLWICSNPNNLKVKRFVEKLSQKERKG
ncbi:C-C motif chemokine 17-like [Hemiscyllium ocellatum]|uniref:C-C motif chemokine 17-like n=1 Tax=Hemiscyllium ocellatum TaxID=170820 RepID=UPI002965D9A3|nr:C-C motif chemokine 17-like [Hemiscyllium ocellatum]